jgi:hypothetical protein
LKLRFSISWVGTKPGSLGNSEAIEGRTWVSVLKWGTLNLIRDIGVVVESETVF